VNVIFHPTKKRGGGGRREPAKKTEKIGAAQQEGVELKSVYLRVEERTVGKRPSTALREKKKGGEGLCGLVKGVDPIHSVRRKSQKVDEAFGSSERVCSQAENDRREEQAQQIRREE